MKPATINKVRIRKLRTHLLERRFAVPKLQRNFVWDPGRAAKLLDSVYRAMPIGSLFLWEMDRKSANLIRQSASVLPPFNKANKHIWFVIDGQQRLSVIYQAFEAQERENDAGRNIDFGRLCFVLNPSRESENPPRVVYRKPVDRGDAARGIEEVAIGHDPVSNCVDRRILAHREHGSECPVRLAIERPPGDGGDPLDHIGSWGRRSARDSPARTDDASRPQSWGTGR